MSLPDLKSCRKPAVDPGRVNSVVQLNVGGRLFTTTLSTLRKIPNSRLADVFSGPGAKLVQDTEGRFVIDRDGTYFGPVLEFLRTEEVPTKNLLEVHKEALFYGVTPLVKLLEETPTFFGEAVGRQQFLSRVRNYHENLEVIIRVARAEAVASRHSAVIVAVLKTEDDVARYNDSVGNAEGRKESIVTFGPWNSPACVEDLLYCIKTDIEGRGYKISINPLTPDRGFLFKSNDFFYKLTFTWW